MIIIEFLRRLTKLLALYEQRYRTRRQLTQLSDRALQDIGVTKSEALMEAKKAFWKV